MWFQIEIKDGKHSAYHFKEKLKADGFLFIKSGKYTGKWVKRIEDGKEVKAISKYYKNKGLKVIYFSKYEQRSSVYREQYLKTHPPKIGNYYICCYCSRLLKKEQVSVDHRIPVDKVKKSKLWRTLIKILQFDSINDNRNLAISCERCNRKKSNQTGVWIIRGFLGNYFIYWILIYLSIIAVLGFIISYWIR